MKESVSLFLLTLFLYPNVVLTAATDIRKRLTMFPIQTVVCAVNLMVHLQSPRKLFPHLLALHKPIVWNRYTNLSVSDLLTPASAAVRRNYRVHTIFIMQMCYIYSLKMA